MIANGRREVRLTVEDKKDGLIKDKKSSPGRLGMEMKEREKLEGDKSNPSLSTLAIKEKRELRASEGGNPKVRYWRWIIVRKARSIEILHYLKVEPDPVYSILIGSHAASRPLASYCRKIDPWPLLNKPNC